METIKTKIVDPDCNISHFVAVADLLIRRPHLIKSRKKLVAGAVIVSQVNCDIEAEGIILGKNLRQKYKSEDFSCNEQNYSSEELDYDTNSIICRNIVYKGGLRLEKEEWVVWKIQEGFCKLDVIPRRDDLLEKNEVCFTKCQYSLGYNELENTISLQVDSRCVNGKENR